MKDTTANLVVESSLGDSWAGIFLLFVLFCLFLGGALGYGALLRRAFPGRSSLLIRVSDSFLLGSVMLYAGAFSLAAIHALALFPGWIYAVLFLPGLAAILPLVQETIGVEWKRRPFACLVFLLIFFVRALSAALPAQHGDPLLYHLLGPRLWVEAGGFIMHPDLPNALLASTWECLYVWPQLFWISARPFFGLVEAQIFSQWLHLFLAWGGCGLLVMRIFRGSVRDSWLPLAGLAALFVSGVQWTAPLAKNDVGIAFWVLGALVFFSEAIKENRGWKGALSGLFAGLAIAGKITALLSLAPVMAMLVIGLWPKTKLRQLLKLALYWCGGCLAGAVPLYIRNFLLSQNPFFPLFPKMFPSPWMSRSWEAHFSQVHPSSPIHSLGRLASRIPELIHETHWALGAVFLLLFALLSRKRVRGVAGDLASAERLALLSGALIAYGIFVVTQAPEIELRYLGASLMLLSGGGICFLLQFAEKLPGEKFRNAAAVLVLVIALATSRLPLHIVRKIWNSPLGVNFVRSHSAGEAKAWVRQHANGSFTILAGDNETYYLTPVGVAVLTERPDFDTATEKTDFSSFITSLCSLSHARYLLDARPSIGVQAKFGAAALLPALVFSAQNANVYDLSKLNSQCR